MTTVDTQRESSGVVEVRREFACGTAELWRCVTVPRIVSAWFEPCRRDRGGRYEIRFSEDGNAYSKYATVVEGHRSADGGRFRFRLEDEGYPDSVVEVEVTPRGAGGSALRLRHLDPPPSLAEGYREGWADYLAALARYLAGRATGRAGGR
ncbi:SRPBCC family protein [Amycolatopsis vastitatis]|uniref:SRPBCC family protein n=1 Tax=Amycolatopsis vastitatis TaxID=1905142 RepID=UPI0013044CEB|nr:SRPBCC domain-containing protein [Amycolatopsis vastitatis]